MKYSVEVSTDSVDTDRKKVANPGICNPVEGAI
jgi:hypothetical protein